MMTPTVSAAAGYKWRLVIAYDGTHYAGFISPFCSLALFRSQSH
jgi:hypothetical protein